MPRTADIAGGGLVGLALAAALGQAGWSVRLHEAAPALRATGGGLYLQERGITALGALGVADDVARAAWRPAFFETRLDGERGTYAANDGLFLTMIRQQLHQILREAALRAHVDVRTHARVIALEPEGALVLEGGQRFDADLVVAADGTASQAAARLGLLATRQRYREGLIRVLADRSAVSGPCWEGTIDFWSYRHRPLRLLYSPLSRSQCYLAFMAPVGDAEALALPVNAPLWSRSFPELAGVLEGLQDPGRFDRYGSIRLRHWSKGRVAFIGDAAHAMPSSLGQGANVGISNAVALATHLSASADIDAALQRWEAAQRPLIEAIQTDAEQLIAARALEQGRPAREPEFVPGTTRRSA